MAKSLYTEIQRELYIVKHGQEGSFRIKKWMIICLFTTLFYIAYGFIGVAWFMGSSLIFGIFVHFFFRFKTKGWKKPWWIMKQVIKTPFD